MEKGWTKKASRATKEAAELNDLVAEAKSMQVQRKKRGKPAAAAAAAAAGADKTPDLYLDTSMVCDTCGEEWQKVEGEEPSRVIQNCGVCLVASVCSQRCASLHHRKMTCIQQGEDPMTVMRRILWLATMKRCGTPVHETPLDRAEAAKERRTAAAAAKRAAATAAKGTQAPAAVAAAAAVAADAPRERGQKRAAPSDPEDTKVSKKSKEKHDSAAWPACVSADAPCMQPGSETRRWFVPCADPECPSRRNAERRALLELTHKSTRDWLGSSSSIAEAKLHLAALRSRLSIAGLRYDGDE
jgi:hypothetical protein